MEKKFHQMEKMSHQMGKKSHRLGFYSHRLGFFQRLMIAEQPLGIILRIRLSVVGFRRFRT